MRVWPATAGSLCALDEARTVSLILLLHPFIDLSLPGWMGGAAAASPWVTVLWTAGTPSDAPTASGPVIVRGDARTLGARSAPCCLNDVKLLRLPVHPLKGPPLLRFLLVVGLLLHKLNSALRRLRCLGLVAPLVSG